MYLNKFKFLFFLPLLAMIFVACNNEVTYSEMKEKERDAVKRYIKEKGIKIITFDEFVANDSVTDYLMNEFVEVDDVYMQIVRNPKDASDARRIEQGDTRNLLVRYTEYNILDDDTISSNKYASEPDEMRVTNNSGTYTAAFVSGIMSSIYGNAVPVGWLTPLNFLYFTRQQGNLAKVNLIVPHSKGTSTAATYVYPCLYEITFQPENLYDFEDDEVVGDEE